VAMGTHRLSENTHRHLVFAPGLDGEAEVVSKSEGGDEAPENVEAHGWLIRSDALGIRPLCQRNPACFSRKF
jgi:hypothetical protein